MSPVGSADFCRTLSPSEMANVTSVRLNDGTTMPMLGLGTWNVSENL